MNARARTSPRKIPRQSRSQATVDAILTATARVLVREGYDRASTNRIALAAGVSVGSLYQYFPSKEALVAALIERHMDQMCALLESKIVAVAHAPLETAVGEVVRAMLAAHAVDPALHKVLIEQVPRVGRMGKVQEVERRVATLVRGYLDSHRRSIRPVDLDRAVFVLVHAVEALTHAAVIDERLSPSDEPLANEITTLVLRYLAP